MTGGEFAHPIVAWRVIVMRVHLARALLELDRMQAVACRRTKQALAPTRTEKSRLFRRLGLRQRLGACERRTLPPLKHLSHHALRRRANSGNRPDKASSAHRSSDGTGAGGDGGARPTATGKRAVLLAVFTSLVCVTTVATMSPPA